MLSLNTNEQQLNNTFQALSDATRRSILTRIRSRDETVSDIAAHYDMSLPAVTKHLNILERAGLIARKKAGRQRFCRAEPAMLNDAVEWLNHYQQFWDERLDNLKQFLETNKP